MNRLMMFVQEFLITRIDRISSFNNAVQNKIKKVTIVKKNVALFKMEQILSELPRDVLIECAKKVKIWINKHLGELVINLN